MEKDFSEKTYFHKACGIVKCIVAKSIYVCQVTPFLQQDHCLALSYKKATA